MIDAENEQELTEQPLPARSRHDLLISCTGSASHPLWTVKDPLTEKFYQLRQFDYFVFSQLDGTKSITDIQRAFFARFAPQRLSCDQILSFVHQLFSQGLIQLDRFGLGKLIQERAQKIQSSQAKQKLTGLLAIRFRGIDPDRWLETTLPLVRWLFSPVTKLLCSLLMLSALVLVLVEIDQISRELPNFDSIIGGGHLLWFMAILAGVKVIHELGHAFACKYHGGECHELGIMLLAFTPCLYCNVSDAWLLQSRRKRIAISAAGIYVEMVIAALCAWLWYFSVPGIVHTTCLYLMVISSVSTLFLNGNPLLRYDGYYILSDLVGIPNLRSRAQGLVRSWWMKFCLGVRPADSFRGQRVSLLFVGTYGISSSLYVWFVIFAILWMLYQIAKPYGLHPLVIAFGLMILSLKVGSMLGTGLKLTKKLQQQKELRWGRFLCSSLIVIGAFIGLLLLEVPRNVRAFCVVEPAEVSPVYVNSPGQIQFQNLEEGTSVEQGTQLAKLINLDLEQEVLGLKGQVERRNKQIELLQLRQSQDASAAAEIPTVRSALLDLERQLEQKSIELKRLEIHAPQAGLILANPEQSKQLQQEPDFKQRGDSIAQHNNGAWLNAGTQLCSIAASHNFEAVLYVDQSEVVLLRPGIPVEFATDAGATGLSGTVIEIAANVMTDLPPALLQQKRFALQPDEEGRLQPVQPLHEVRVRLDHGPQIKITGQTGTARIRLADERIVTKMMRTIRRTLTFQL